jgi:hypothetical protein
LKSLSSSNCLVSLKPLLLFHDRYLAVGGYRGPTFYPDDVTISVTL